MTAYIDEDGNITDVPPDPLMKKKKIKGEITVIDPKFIHIYQPGFLLTMFGKEDPKKLIKNSIDLMPKETLTIKDSVNLIDPQNQVVVTDNYGNFEYDYLVIASGSRINLDAVDWWDDSIHQFYTMQGSDSLYQALEKFEGGNIVVSIADLPYNLCSNSFCIPRIFSRCSTRSSIRSPMFIVLLPLIF